MRLRWLSLFALLLALLAPELARSQEQTVIRMMAGPGYGIPPRESTNPREMARRAVFEEFHRRNPDIRVVNAGGLELVGDRAESGFLMSMAGDTSPDVFYVNFRQYFSYIDQGFCLPLDRFLEQDEATQAAVHPEIEEVLRSYDSNLYAIPFFQVAQALYYRKDHFAQAGLDPNDPPRTWDEFVEYGRRLSEVESGRTGFAFSRGPGGRAYHWTNFVWQAGGEVLVPAERGYARSAVATDEAAVALDFYRKLTKETWTGEDGETYGPLANVSPTYARDILDGKVSMWFSYTNDVMLSMSDLNPNLIGIAAMPQGPAGSFNEINAGMWAINATITDEKKLEACWRFIQFFTSDEAHRISTERFVELGLGKLVNPVLLKKFGYDDLAATVDPAYVRANERLFETGKPEPYGRNSQQVYLVLDTALDRAVLEDTPSLEILQDVSREMDRKLLGFIPEDEMNRQRTWAFGFLFVLGAVATGFGARSFIKWRLQQNVVEDRLAAGTNRKAIWRFIGLCLAPAVLSMVIWMYYPLVRGLVIGFQDYRIIQGYSWVGLDNFIAVFTQPLFWKSLWNSFLYVGLTLLIGFFLPVFLALALHEIPRFKVLLRTIFYLPAMTSPIVIAFLWRQFYDSSEAGLLNTIVAPFIAAFNGLFGTSYPLAYDWLGDPKLAMFAVVLPGIWAGAGPGSILYLAALKNIPEDRYEAADIDGASWTHKIRYITLPGIWPLVLINLLGAFIAGFKAMENIFVLTGGGPLHATHTIGLEIWTNAFMFLKFGYATAAAWVMGAILIGFTIVQIRYLTRLKFTAVRN
jgi:multiple sugar transport system permease protein